MRASSSLEWLRRKLDKSIYLDQLEAIVSADLQQTVGETCTDIIEPFVKRTNDDLLSFIDEHCTTIAAFSHENQGKLDVLLNDLQSSDVSLVSRAEALRAASDILDDLETVYKAGAANAAATSEV